MILPQRLSLLKEIAFAPNESSDVSQNDQESGNFLDERWAEVFLDSKRWDASLWWGGQGFGFKAVAAAAISYPNQDNTDYQYDGSLSVLHEATGLNLTLSGGLKELDDQGDNKNFYAKAGWLTQFFSAGQTAFAVDFTRSVNFPTGRDDGYSVGSAAVHQFEEFGTELYSQYHLYSLNRDVAPNVDNINVGTIGARVKF